jgi:hypothetical protein
MTTTRRRLAALCLGVLVLELAATAVAVALDLPAQFGGAGTDAGAEFASRGTAVSPPLAPLAVLALAAVLLFRGGRAAVAGAVLAGLLGVVFAVASVGEAVAPATPEVARAVLVGSGVVGVAVGAALVAGAVLSLRQQVQARARQHRLEQRPLTQSAPSA